MACQPGAWRRKSKVATVVTPTNVEDAALLFKACTRPGLGVRVLKHGSLGLELGASRVRWHRAVTSAIALSRWASNPVIQVRGTGNSAGQGSMHSGCDCVEGARSVAPRMSTWQ